MKNSKTLRAIGKRASLFSKNIFIKLLVYVNTMKAISKVKNWLTTIS